MAHYSALYLKQLGEMWQRQYHRTSGKKAPPIKWENGWFIVNADRYRRVTLERMIDSLMQRPTYHEQANRND